MDFPPDEKEFARFVDFKQNEVKSDCLREFLGVDLQSFLRSLSTKEKIELQNVAKSEVKHVT